MRERQREQKEETRTKCQIERGRKTHTAAHRRGERRPGSGPRETAGAGTCPFLSGGGDLGLCLLPTGTGPGAASSGSWLTEMNEIPSSESLGSLPRAGS